MVSIADSLAEASRVRVQRLRETGIRFTNTYRKHGNYKNYPSDP